MKINNIFINCRIVLWIPILIMMITVVVGAQPDTARSPAFRMPKSYRTGPLLDIPTGRAIAARAVDSAEKAKYYFYFGLRYQDRARTDASAGYDTMAIKWYKEALKARPQFRPALNNLAELYMKAGNPEVAVRYLRQAAADSTRKQYPLYAFNLAKALEAAGKKKESADLLKKLILRRTESGPEEDALIKLLIKNDFGDLTRFIYSTLLDENYSHALSLSLKTLKLDKGMEPGKSLHIASPTKLGADILKIEDKRILLCIAVKSIGYMGPGPEAFKSSSIYTDLESLKADNALSTAIKDIFNLYRGELSHPDTYAWWEDNQYYIIAGPPLVPYLALADLVRGIGNWYHNSGNLDAASHYYDLALKLSGETPAPELIVDISDLLVAKDDYDGLERLVKNNVPRLFEAKGEAYREKNYKAIYSYHRSLGLIFANLEQRTGQRTGVASAEFQLGHAIETAEMYDREASMAPRPDSIILEKHVVDKLTETYKRNNKAGKASDLQKKMLKYHLK
jgi:tetratricopeptide (TPR) repeat protein